MIMTLTAQANCGPRRLDSILRTDLAAAVRFGDVAIGLGIRDRPASSNVPADWQSSQLVKESAWSAKTLTNLWRLSLLGHDQIQNSPTDRCCPEKVKALATPVVRSPPANAIGRTARSFTRDNLRVLQRVVGNSAVMQLLNRTTPSGNAAEVPVQRDVGFEFELDDTVKTYQKSFLGGYKPLTKREKVINGVDFYVEADGLPNGLSSWEFVTTKFPETLPGLIQLMQALDKIDGIVNVLIHSTLTVRGTPAYNQVGPAFATFGTPVADRYFTINNTTPRTKPQITAGFALAALNQLFASATTLPGLGASNLALYSANMDNQGQIPDLPQVDLSLGRMRDAAGAAITELLGAPPDPSLQALVTQLMQVIIQGQENIGATPKTVLRLVLHRTDMKHTFDQLPPPIRNQLRANPEIFVHLVMMPVNTIKAVAENTPVISGLLFADAQYANDPRHNTPSPFLQVTCRQWLTNIAAAGGSDLLSMGSYPVRTNLVGHRNPTDRKANKLLGSMGALHGILDPANRPIFEIRSSRQIHAGLIPAYALDFFKYVRYLHNPGGLTESAELSGMATADIINLIGFTPDRRAAVHAMQTRAANNFNN